MPTAAELKKQYEQALYKEQEAKLKAAQRAKLKQQEELAAQQKKHEHDEMLLWTGKLRGKVVSHVILDVSGEGTITLHFTDGTKFGVTASGDCATYIIYGDGELGY
jgi:hypothetical protein